VVNSAMDNIAGMILFIFIVVDQLKISQHAESVGCSHR